MTAPSADGSRVVLRPIGLLLGLVALYAALALALEGAQSRTVLPLARREPASEEPGVRRVL